MKKAPFLTQSVEQLVNGAPDALKAHVESFMKNGFAIVPDSVDEALIDAARAEFETFKSLNAEICNKHKGDDGHLRRIVNSHLAFEGIRTLFQENPLALALQDYLYGAETCIYTSLLFEAGSQQPIHRDSPYFTTVPEYTYFGMWVAMEDVDEDNGPLQLIPGGHLSKEQDREAIARRYYNRPEDIDAFSPQLWDDYQKAVVDQCLSEGLSVQTAPMKKGSTLVWHPQLPHGGSIIKQMGRTRMSVVFHTTPPDTPVYHQDVFFNPAKKVAAKARWSYSNDGKRRYAVTADTICFEHKEDMKISKIKRPQKELA